MTIQTYVECLTVGQVDGPTLTAAAAASCIPTNSKFTLPNNFFYIGRMLRLYIAGRISCAVTTPGTARFDVRMGAVIAFDTLALNLNVVAKVNVPFVFEAELTCRAVGNGVLTTLFGQGKFTSEAVVGAPLPSAGGNGVLLAPVGVPAVGTGFDNTLANSVDCFFTQTVATGSMTVHQYRVESVD